MGYLCREGGRRERCARLVTNAVLLMMKVTKMEMTVMAVGVVGVDDWVRVVAVVQDLFYFSFVRSCRDL